MKQATTHIASLISKRRALILFGTLAVAATTVACSSKSKPAANQSQPIGASVRPAVLETVSPASRPTPVNVALNDAAPVKLASKPITYKSRDYGVSFVYPWQYAYMSAKAIANGDEDLQPKSDGHEGQFTLVRVDIPKGFYPESDFDSGYFTLSLNDDLSEEECESVLGASKDDKVQTESVNGADFLWIESESGSHGSAAKLRNYVNFTNGTCYEVELGVKTRNDGLAREIDPDQVMRRLDSILKTVKIAQAVQNPATQQLESSAKVPALQSQN